MTLKLKQLACCKCVLGRKPTCGTLAGWIRVTEGLVDSVAAVVIGAGAGVVVVSDDAVLEMSPGSVGSFLVSPGSVGSGRTVCSPPRRTAEN